MRLARLGLLAIVLAAPAAAAQTAAGSGATATPAPAPSASAPSSAPPARTGVMANRWALTVGLGVQALKSSDTAGADNIAFATYELGGRFRIIPSIEVALSLAAGANRDDSYASVWADVRYRFLAERPWNIYAYLGLGAGAAGAKDGSDAERHGRGALRLGGGVERRFDVFALSAELRVLGFAMNDQSPLVEPPTTRYELSRDAISGLGLVLGATYYF